MQLVRLDEFWYSEMGGVCVGVGVMGSCSDLWCEWRNLMGKEGNM